MKIAIFSLHNFDKPFFVKINIINHELVYLQEKLYKETAYLAKYFKAIVIFTSNPQ